MLDLLIRMNRTLRNIILIIGAVAALLKITEKKEKEREINTSEEGFQIKEFDDIW